MVYLKLLIDLVVLRSPPFKAKLFCSLPFVPTLCTFVNSRSFLNTVLVGFVNDFSSHVYCAAHFSG